MVPKLEGMSESLKGLVNRLLGPNSKLSHSVELGWCLGICVSVGLQLGGAYFKN